MLLNALTTLYKDKGGWTMDATLKEQLKQLEESHINFEVRKKQRKIS